MAESGSASQTRFSIQTEKKRRIASSPELRWGESKIRTHGYAPPCYGLAVCRASAVRKRS